MDQLIREIRDAAGVELGAAGSRAAEGVGGTVRADEPEGRPGARAARSRRGGLIWLAAAGAALALVALVVANSGSRPRAENLPEDQAQLEDLELPDAPAQPQHRAEPASAPAVPSPGPLTAPPVDLLPMIDAGRDRVRGRWVAVDGGLRAAAGKKEKAFTMAIPWNPPSEYRLRVRVTRNTRDSGLLAIGLASGEHRAVVVLDQTKRGKEGTVNGLLLARGCLTLYLHRAAPETASCHPAGLSRSPAP